MRSGPRISRSAWPRYCGRSPARRSGCGGSSSQKGRSSSAGSGSAPAAQRVAPGIGGFGPVVGLGPGAAHALAAESRAEQVQQPRLVLRRAAGFGKQRGAGGGLGHGLASRATAMTGSVSVMRSSFSRSRPRICAGCQAGCDSASSSSVGGRARRPRSCSRLSVILRTASWLAASQPPSCSASRRATASTASVCSRYSISSMRRAKRARLDPALRLGRQTIGGVQRRQQFGRCAAAGRRAAAGRPAWRSRCPAASPGAAAPGQQGQRQRVEPANERGQGQHPPAGAPFAALRQQPGAGGGGRHAQRHPQVQCPQRGGDPATASARATEELQAGAHAQQHGGLVGQRDLGRIAAGPARRLAARRPRPADCAAAARPGARWRRPARRMSIRTPARRAAGVRAITRSCSSTAYAWASSGQCGRMASSGRQRRQAAIQRRMAGGCFEGAGLQAHVQRRIAGRPRRLRIWMDSPPGAGASASRKGGRGVGGGGGRTQGDEQQVAAWAARCSRRSDSGRTWGSRAGRRSCRS